MLAHAGDALGTRELQYDDEAGGGDVEDEVDDEDDNGPGRGHHACDIATVMNGMSATKIVQKRLSGSRKSLVLLYRGRPRHSD